MFRWCWKDCRIAVHPEEQARTSQLCRCRQDFQSSVCRAKIRVAHATSTGWDLSTIENLQNLATTPAKLALFPTFSIAARRILLLPIGTAGVERSFSTMNRIMCSERCHLLPDHVNYLMLISIEGPVTPDIRDGTAEEEAQLVSLTDNVYAIWQRKHRRVWPEYETVNIFFVCRWVVWVFWLCMYYMFWIIGSYYLITLTLAMLPC